MGAWADIIKVLRSTIFKNELKKGNYSVKHATKADEMASLTAIGSGADSVARYVWFSDSTTTGKPWGDSEFKYNPSTDTLMVGTVKTKNLTLSAPATSTSKTLSDEGYYLICAQYNGASGLEILNSGLLYWKKGYDVEINVYEKYNIIVNNKGTIGVMVEDTNVTSNCTIKIKQISIT